MPIGLGQLQDRGTSKALQTRFSLSPDYTLNLSPELAAVVPFDMPELLQPQGWRRFQKGGQIAAVAAQNGQVRIGNPSTTQQLVVCEDIRVSAGATTNFTGLMGTAIGSTNLGALFGTPQFRDSRLPFAGSSIEISGTQTAAPFAASMFLLDALASTVLIVPGAPWILVPGGTLTIQCQLVNTAFNFCIVWRERIIQEQENTP